MDVVAHQTIAVKPEGLPYLRVRNRLEEGVEVSFALKNRLSIVAAVDHVVDEAVGDRA